MHNVEECWYGNDLLLVNNHHSSMQKLKTLHHNAMDKQDSGEVSMWFISLLYIIQVF
jgi:hypothetical protein